MRPRTPAAPCGNLFLDFGDLQLTGILVRTLASVMSSLTTGTIRKRRQKTQEERLAGCRLSNCCRWCSKKTNAILWVSTNRCLSSGWVQNLDGKLNGVTSPARKPIGVHLFLTNNCDYSCERSPHNQCHIPQPLDTGTNRCCLMRKCIISAVVTRGQVLPWRLCPRVEHRPMWCPGREQRRGRVRALSRCVAGWTYPERHEGDTCSMRTGVYTLQQGATFDTTQRGAFFPSFVAHCLLASFFAAHALLSGRPARIIDFVPLAAL